MIIGPKLHGAPWAKLLHQQVLVQPITATPAPPGPTVPVPKIESIVQRDPTQPNQTLRKLTEVVASVFNSLYQQGTLYISAKSKDGVTWGLAGAAGGVTGFNGRSGNITFLSSDLPLSGVGAGVYPYATVTVDSHGIVTAISTGKIAQTFRVTTDVVQFGPTKASLVDLTAQVLTGKTYSGRLVLKCRNSTDTEGIDIDFFGGTATATNFWAAGDVLVGGTSLLSNGITSALSGSITFITITNETVIMIEFSLRCLAGGSFVPRFALDNDLGGTDTVREGSYMMIQETN